MSRLSITTRLEMILISFVLFTTNVSANNQNISKPTRNKQHPISTFKLLYKEGLIDANITKVPLKKVLNELETKTGAKVIVYDPSILNTQLSVSLTNIPLEKTIEILLEGFSYVFFLSKDGYVIIVLSTDSTIDRSDRTIYHSSYSVAEQEKLMHKAKRVEAVLKNNIPNTAPRSLNEFQPISLDDLNLNTDTDNNIKKNEHLTVEQQQQEFVIQRALDIIASEHKHLYKEALSQLIGINDPRATEALIDATVSEAGWLSRNQAVDALWQHAVNLQFSDISSIDALKQLTTDNDEKISRIALEALDEINQYKE